MARASLHQAPGASAPGAIFRVVLLTLLLAPVVFAGQETTRDPDEYFFTQTFGDLPEEMEAARKGGKLGMLLFFYADACSYCQYMLRKVLSQERVQDWYRERFVNIAIDIHGDVEVRDFDGITLPSKVFAEHRRVYMTPVVSILDLDGAEIYRHLGMIRTPEEFLLLGEYIEGGHYFDTEFREFASRRGMPDDEAQLMTPAGETE